MENFIVSARKYRPQEFQTVVGQSHVTDTLEHAIENHQLAQALLFCGPRGVGKTTCARILARKINEKDGTTSDDGFAYNIYELDAASNNSVDDIRDLIDQVRFAPQVGQYKVYIIDEVHMLSQAAFNAFLKTLEEPPAHAIFILATTEKHKIIPTILSRCQIYDFKRITIESIQDHLKEIAEKEQIQYEEDALYLVAQKADGALRDALSIFDRLATFTHKNITLQRAAEVLNILDYDQYLNIVELAFENKIPEVLSAFDDIVKKGFDAHIFIAGLGNHFRDLMMAKNPTTLHLIEVGEQTRVKYKTQSERWNAQQMIDAIEICNHADIHYKASKNPRLTVEIALMQLASLTANLTNTKKKKFIILPPHHEEGNSTSKEKKLTQISVSQQNRIEQKTTITPEKQPEKVKISNKPLGTEKRVSKYNIQENLKVEKVEEKEIKTDFSTDLPKDNFTNENLLSEWDSFLSDIQMKDKLIHFAIHKFKINKLNETQIQIVYPSASAKTEFEKVSGQFLNQLKQKLNNHHISFDFHMDVKNFKVEVKTKKKVFEDFCKINPLLGELNEYFKFDLN